MAQIHIAEDPLEWVSSASRFIAAAAREALSERNRFTLALSGGSTPRPVYQSLPETWQAHNLSWQQVHILWSDERCVALDHPRSNFRMARQALLDRIQIPAENIHPMRCESDPSAAAQAYETDLREIFPLMNWPRIDLVLLGLGTDGHTASLFPHSETLEKLERWVVSDEVSQAELPRLTLTIPAINAARRVAFLVAGADKAAIIHTILRDAGRKSDLPAQAIDPLDGELHWLLDKAAAGKIIEP